MIEILLGIIAKITKTIVIKIQKDVAQTEMIAETQTDKDMKEENEAKEEREEVEEEDEVEEDRVKRERGLKEKKDKVSLRRKKFLLTRQQEKLPITNMK